jgi:hypothetical protein
MADFLLHIVHSPHVTRSELIIKQACAAIGLIHRTGGFPSPTDDPLFRRFKHILIQQRTLHPMKSATPIPFDPVLKLILTLGSNSTMPLEELRNKTIALITFCLYLRPGEGATSWKRQHIAFGFDNNINCKYMEFCLLGFKTDHSAKGESFKIYAASDLTLDRWMQLKLILPVLTYCWTHL